MFGMRLNNETVNQVSSEKTINKNRLSDEKEF